MDLDAKVYKKKKKKSLHKYLKEFKKRAPFDGIILYSSGEIKDEIIKIKPLDLLTVDLQYEGNDIFLDANNNVYIYYTSNEKQKDYFDLGG